MTTCERGSAESNCQQFEVALALYQQGSADFFDCLHVALARSAGEQPLIFLSVP